MAVLENCKPERVFHYFEEICNIPHPSYHEEKISAYLVDFAKSHNLEYYQDDLYNVIMIKEAAKGYENVAPIVIQGHMDMVAEQEDSCTKDMLNEGLDLEIVDGFVEAKGTTLGGDDGIAVAVALALLEDDTLQAPRLEVIITVSEEVGMEGAAGIDVSMIKGRKLLNLDSEEEGIFTVGCAGGCRLDVKYEASRTSFEGKKIEIEVSECTGGHSGTEIDKGRANATHLVNRLLTVASSLADIQLVTYTGGSKDNAIPRATSATFMVSNEGLEKIGDALLDEASAIANEYAITDPDMEIVITDGEPATEDVIGVEDTKKLISMINGMPDGVQTMSHDIEGLVETSLNLGILETTDEYIRLSFAIRSSVESAKAALIRKVESIANAFGAKTSKHGMYPAWEYVRDSKLRDEMVAIYEQMYGKKPEVVTIHAGLECGLLSSKLPGLEAVSIGPELYDIHTPKERLSIASTERMYEYVKAVLAAK